MFRLVAVFALLSCACAATMPDDLDGRIVGGVDTTIQAHPYQVSLQKLNGNHFCGGSIVNSDTIVTAAHCVVGTTAGAVLIRVGTTNYKTGGEVVAVKKINVHPGYNSKIMINDFAVLKLATPVRESKTVKYIALASKTPATGTPAVVTGWGTTCFLACTSLPTTLQEVEVGIVDWKECASSKYRYGDAIMDTMVCAYAAKKDACQGDSGGPLVSQSRLVGVVSWGNGCARDGYPGVYGDIASARTWIDSLL